MDEYDDEFISDDNISEIDDNEEDEDIDDSLSSSKSEEDLGFKAQNEEIAAFKRENIQDLSENFIISYLSHVVEFISQGGPMTDGRQEFEYPYDTVESYALESILLGTTPFIWIIEQHSIVPSLDKIILLLKILLRSNMDHYILLSVNFRKKFPLFIRNINSDHVTPQEINEIKYWQKRATEVRNFS